ncbi:MAG: efflux RND transporter periplasmic adaptor subunit [Deltaproteobacteria bacterium]|nr:efflux RND transporter periplasmic adaptor subunit [Deltaproteobacteria bacterium]MBW2051570.1 efflux RND transporter periplasmic adaptor subunit [Deltaproteobacteria bacterium]MBW2139885.1 efflux RND transporter periplasmic adaptor subunit [Deltaproteobacteria bacterium]MBW2324274.1 efflux RND transporter periplasmic adaptor subunit [Deltaproteobacteria bacterium]
MKRYIFISLIILISCLVLVSLVGCEAREGKAQNKNDNKSNVSSVRESAGRVVNVTTIVITPTLIRDLLILPGEIMPWQDVRVSSCIGGLVEWVGPREGRMVKKGELLAKINVSALKVSLERAEAAFELADKVYQRLKRLYERKIITQENLDQASTERTLALGTLRQLKIQYEDGFVRAPISGVVNKLFVDAGEFVGPGTPMFDLVDIWRLKIDISVPEMDVRYLKVKQKAMVKVDAFLDRLLEGTVDFVAYKADPATRTFRVYVVVENPKRDIRAGMIARVALIKRQIPDALIVPLSALVDKNGERLVFVEEDGVARARTVSIGVIEKDRVQITKGLRTGDHLIVIGQKELEEGVRVQVQ